MLFLERNRHELAVHMLRNVSLSQGYDLEVIEKIGFMGVSNHASNNLDRV
jgi:hypothetical protein